MQSWLTIIGGVLMAIVVYELLRRQVLKRAALKIRRAGQRTVDSAMVAAFKVLANAMTIQEVAGAIHSVPVADVWGVV